MALKQLSVAGRLNPFNLELQAGEVLGLIGPNGAGKSTVLNAIAGSLEYEGLIKFRHKDIKDYSAREKAQKLALQPQFVESVWSVSVHDIVSMGRIPWGDTDQSIIAEAMRLANIEPFAQRPVNQLSGGEQARVWLARVIANQAEVLLVDEPVANLDIHYQQEVMQLLSDYARQGHSVMIALHDLSLAAKYCSRLCLLKDGNMVKMGQVQQVLTPSIINDCYKVDIHIDLASDPPVVIAR